MYTVNSFLSGSLFVLVALAFIFHSCTTGNETAQDDRLIPTPDFTLTSDQTHNKFSSAIPPVLTVPSGSVIEAFTEEASDKQFQLGAGVDAILNLDFEPIHPLTGPVYVEEAQPGDILAVTLHKIEMGDWGWTAIAPGFGFLADEFPDAAIKTFPLGKDATSIDFGKGINIPLSPFPGVMGVAPATDSLLSTIPSTLR